MARAERFPHEEDSLEEGCGLIVDLGGGTLDPPGVAGASFVARYDIAGNHVAWRGLGFRPTAGQVRGVASGPASAAIARGWSCESGYQVAMEHLTVHAAPDQSWLQRSANRDAGRG